MKSNTVSTFVFALILLAGAGYGLYYVAEAIEMKTETVRIQREKERQSENFEFGNQLRNNLKTLSEQEAVIHSAFISAPNMVDFIQTLESSARQYDLDISIDKVEQGEAETLSENVKTIPVTFSIQTAGTYEQTKSFVTDMLKLDKKLVLTDIDLFKSEERTYTSKMTVKGIILSNE